MKKPKPAAPLGSLFARKGEAAPAPAVGYVGITDLEGRFNRRRGQANLDCGERRHPERAPEPPPAQAPAGKRAKAPAAKPEPEPEPEPPSHGEYRTSLSSLILRRRPANASQPTAASTPPEQRARERPASGAGDAAPEPARADQGPPLAPPVRRGKRRKLTLRLEQDHYKRIRDIVRDTDSTYQDVLSTAVARYLDSQE
jgi:hypothetical protein